MADLPPVSGLRPVADLAGELLDLKRLRAAGSRDSVAQRMFRVAWSALIAGDDPDDVALRLTADAIAAIRLGAIDRAVLMRSGLDEAETHEVLSAAFDDAAVNLDPLLRRSLAAALGRHPACQASVGFVEALNEQPRAGATRRGRARLILEPPETHGDHCFSVACIGVLLSPCYGADATAVFLAGLAHHLHNAVLPDSGFAGELLLGLHLEPIMRRLFDEALASLQVPLRRRIASALAEARTAETPVGRAFNAADVIDRVLEMRHFERVAAFTATQALDDLELVHAGPLQAFHYGVLREAGLP